MKDNQDSNFYQNLSDDQKLIFDKYKGNTNSFCYKINNALRAGTTDEFYKEIKILDGIINLYSNSKVVVLHRATNEYLVLPFIIDNIYINPDFLSTATDLESVQNHFTNPHKPVYITIKCKEGTTMAPFESNKMFSGMENEMLLGRNHKFNIIVNRLSEDKSEIEEIMGRDFAEGVDSIRIIELSNI